MIIKICSFHVVSILFVSVHAMDCVIAFFSSGTLCFRSSFRGDFGFLLRRSDLGFRRRLRRSLGRRLRSRHGAR